MIQINVRSAAALKIRLVPTHPQIVTTTMHKIILAFLILIAHKATNVVMAMKMMIIMMTIIIMIEFYKEATLIIAHSIALCMER